jgi:hypothetical protein
MEAAMRILGYLNTLLLIVVLGLVYYHSHKVGQCQARGFSDWDLPGGCYNITKTYK